MKLLPTMTKALGLAALMAVSQPAFADEPAVIEDGQQIELGVVYKLPSSGTHNCYFVSEKGGMYSIDASTMQTVYSDAEFTKEVEPLNGGFGSTLGYAYNFQTEAGKTYYIYNNFCWGQSFCVTEAASTKLALVEVIPADGSVLTTTPSAEIQFQLNAIPAKDCTAKVAAGANEKTVKPRIQGSGIYVDVTSALNDWYAAGSLKEGDEITVTVSNVKAEGSEAEPLTLSAKYKAAGVAAQRISETIPATFKSYWLKGDNDGIFSLAFDKELSDGAMCQVLYGNQDVDGGFYVEDVPVAVEGKTLTVDFTGKRRAAKEMVTLDAYPEVISWKVYNIKDAKGQYVASPEQGAVGSFSYTAPYVNMEKSIVASEFTPAKGSSLKGVDKLEVYLRGGDVLKFDGFQFTTKAGSTVVALDQCTATPDPKDGSMTYLVPVPEDVKAGTDGVTVTLANLQAIDGYDYKVEATYDTFVITFSDPAEGSVVNQLADGEAIKIETNWSDQYPEMYIEGVIKDLNAKDADHEIITYLYFERQEDKSYSAPISYVTYKFIKGHTYVVECTAYETVNDSYSHAEGAKGAMATGSFSFEGGSDPFIPSDVTLMSVDPANWSTLSSVEEPLVITLTFDQMVNILPKEAFINEGMGMESYFDKIENVEPYDDDVTGKQFSSTWMFTLNPDRLAAYTPSLEVAFRATDMDGKLVVNQDGITPWEEPGETFYFQFTYSTPKATVDFITIPADDAEVETLTQLIVDAEGGIMPSWNLPLEEITVMTMQGEVVATAVDEFGKYDWYGDTGYYFDFNNPITEPGTYVIHIPEGMFSVGEMGDLSVEKNIRVFVGAAPEPIAIKYHTDPEEGTVTSLSKVTLILEELEGDVDFTWAGDIMLYVNGVETLNLSQQDCVMVNGADPDDWFAPLDRFEITLPEEYTADGTYEIVFPAGSIYLNAMDMIANDKEIRLTYTINKSGIAGVEAEGGVYRVFNLSGMFIGEYTSADKLNELPAGLYIVNGKKIYLKK